ncbi:unnamed protein product [Blepharisma stoltei]|uniref:Ribosomal protein S11 n=1 Tax=Blepharisma stoltei TaxID=1481888 RepID=A0AAU9JZ27_9CILI|nr:unnamed protein product [Blepharisma stoltei]
MESSESLKLQSALIATNLLTTGNAIVFDQKSGYGCAVDGILIVTVKGEELSSSNEDYLKSSMRRIISYLLDHIKTESSLEIHFQLNLFSKNNTREFSLLNVQDGKRVIVGEINNGKLFILKKFLFQAILKKSLNRKKKYYS